MKLLDIDEFAYLNGILDKIQGAGMTVVGRVEAYSCKRVTQDKRLARKIQDLQEKACLSPQCVGPLDATMVEADEEGDFCLGAPLAVPSYSAGSTECLLDPESAEDRDALVNLVGTLNVSFSDYDFTDVPASYFSKETPSSVHALVSSRLMGTGEGLGSVGVTNFEAMLWKEIDQVVGLNGSEFYSFNPPSSRSPIEASWSHFLFIQNRRAEVNKLIFLTLSGVAPEDEDMRSIDEFPPSASNTYMFTAPTSPHATASNGRVSSVNSLHNLDISSDNEASFQPSQGQGQLLCTVEQ
eukprot:TRINITY_DN9891_c0_g1_i1.p1 TRINITY_DN9891_c0_g1~~TRINITY_DN9891_c0_g1_i1.p1  ORF type:complete len:296 (+),score=36.68 TRINITY_DN9891_c0_g1_i1:115-1002(+)